MVNDFHPGSLVNIGQDKGPFSPSIKLKWKRAKKGGGGFVEFYGTCTRMSKYL